MASTADVVVIGGGIAGVSAGYFLSESGLDVHLVEAEETLAYHTTGRSAALYLENYGNPVVRRLSIASKPFFADPPEYADGPLWSPRPMMAVGEADRVEEMRAEVESAPPPVPATVVIDASEALRLCPVLRPELVAGALLEPDAMELDVAAIHQTFVRGLRARGGTITAGARVTSLEPVDGGWRVGAGELTITAPVVVNAAGAWCDRIGDLAGVARVGLHPLRRTACILGLDDSIDPSPWPFVAFDGHAHDMQGYMRPEAGGLMVSPGDEIPSEPCDARPEEIDVAIGIDAVGRWTTIESRHVRSSWAGLRSFVADRTLVAGFAPGADGFFWLTGQGGYGIHTSAAMGQATRGLIVDGRLPAALTDHGITDADLAPDRPGLPGELDPAH